MNVREKDPFWPVMLQADDIQVRAAEPDLAQNLHLVTAPQDRENVVASRFVVEFLEKHLFLLLNLGPQEGLEQMLRPEVFQRLRAVPLDADLSHQELILRRNPY